MPLVSPWYGCFLFFAIVACNTCLEYQTVDANHGMIFCTLLHFAIECDQIIVLDNGSMVIKGDYEEINAKRPDIPWILQAKLFN